MPFDCWTWRSSSLAHSGIDANASCSLNVTACTPWTPFDCWTRSSLLALSEIDAVASYLRLCDADGKMVISSIVCSRGSSGDIDLLGANVVDRGFWTLMRFLNRFFTAVTVLSCEVFSINRCVMTAHLVDDLMLREIGTLS